jgi:hypothetical protein|tara:strand:+ start:2617 stop:3006 length:390 start_codon:yes stop_codon:yes gene_type:complete
MVNQNRFGKTDYCECCGWKLDSIHDMRQNGKKTEIIVINSLTTIKELEDWPSREFHKYCWVKIKKYMSIFYGDATEKTHIRYNAKRYIDKYSPEHVRMFFNCNKNQCYQYLRLFKNHKRNYLEPNPEDQ